MMQVSMENTYAFSHLSLWNKELCSTARPVPKVEAVQDFPNESLMLSMEWGFVTATYFNFSLLS